jgi:hypothetical protein
METPLDISRSLPGPRASVLREGSIAGLLGAATVALWFFVIDLARGKPLLMPSALGHIIFHATGVAGSEGQTAHVVAYTIFHVFAFVVVGIIASAILRRGEREPAVIAGGFLLFVVFEAGFYIMTSALSQSKTLGLPSWYLVASGNLISSVVMGAYLWKAYPSLRADLDKGLGGGDG